jgi:ATP-dependent DNA helicase RecG
LDHQSLENPVPKSIPFKLTSDQQLAVSEILADLSQPQPMNRLLMGDVGSGKTVVAGIAAYWMIQAGQSVALVAPTQILAEQHFQTIQKILPELMVTLITSATAPKLKITSQPQFFIGTHAILNRLEIIKPALLIYDEQHRFGVKHRSPGWINSPPKKSDLATQAQPHLLTMSATPIPRSLMLSLFAHLTVSTLNQPPQIKLPTKTWLVPKAKKSEALTWIKTQLTGSEKTEQGLFVCPFINPSETAGFENIAAATATFKDLKKFYGRDPKFKIAHYTV